ncbi:ANTH-domain-containing protein [Trichodelitschia bisporula]|uniref:ANTH-domain-containing protein n=1 Tax=Trichodelitschia bisporula TaxID=703511 RepID=A0A6G1I487_9PEZI|nr:ANTH-domain-containing protein [Trichodelitschia bisporula]
MPPMASSFEKSVKGGTKQKLAPPKSKYVEHILIATHAGDAGVAEIFRALQNRLRDSTWTIVFKSLIIIHLMIREGEPDVTLKFLSGSPQRKLAINNFTEVQTQGRNIRCYAEYLLQRAVSFGATKVDYVRHGEGRLKRLTVERGLLRETESVQEQIRALVRCDFFTHEPENEITLMAFRLLTMDLLVLFHVMNEGTINVLEHFFEMSKPDAERALKIYRTFVKQTDQVVQYLSIARHYEHATRLEIPKIKHAPTSLAGSLDEYVKDPEFDSNRRQYLAQQTAKKGAKPTNGATPAKPDRFNSPSKKPAQTVQAAPPKAESKGPAPDLIDLFESIEQNQQPMAQNVFNGSQYGPGVAPQQTGFEQPNFAMQNTGAPQGFGGQNGQGSNPFAQLQQQQQQQFLQQQQLQQQQQQQPQGQQMQPNFTGAGFGGYSPAPQNRFTPALSSIPQSNVAAPFSLQTQQSFNTGSSDPASAQSTNPFRQSMLPSATGTSTSSFASAPTGLSRQSTNPFAKQSSPQTPPTSNSPFSPSQSSPYSQPPPQQQPQFSQQQPSFQQPQFTSQPQSFQQQQPSFSQPPPQPMVPAQTGTNPFARSVAPPTSSAFAPAPALSATPTGSTNPFRQSTFVNQQTGQGWQAGPQGTIGGYASEQIPTLPIFPRPGQPQGQQQQQQNQQQQQQNQQQQQGW